MGGLHRGLTARAEPSQARLVRPVRRGLVVGEFETKTHCGPGPRLAPEKAAPIRDHVSRPCKHCGSKNTVCVFDDSAGSIIGYHAEEEFLCSDCGYFTAYIIHYES